MRAPWFSSLSSLWRSTLWLPSLIIMAICGFAGLLWVESASKASQSLIGQQAPLNHPLLTDGQPTLINFWFSSCAPCRAEHPVLMTMAANGLTVLGINRDVSTDDARAFLNELGNPFAAQLYDPADQIADAFQIEAWPTSVLVAGNGIVQALYGPLIDPNARADMRLISAPETLFDDPQREAQAQALFTLINCLDCEANTVRESGGDFALQMRKLVRAWLAEGQSIAEIRDALISRYGPKIWLDPAVNLTTIWLYALPVFVMGLGLFVIWQRGRRG